MGERQQIIPALVLTIPQELLLENIFTLKPVVVVIKIMLLLLLLL
jgi:hypothetical protein